MAVISELSVKLLTRFQDVPNVGLEDVTNWVEWSFMEHGYRTDQNIPTSAVPLVLLHAEADGTSQIALRTAYYFEYKDGEESVDKSMVSDQFRTLADKLWERYNRKKSEGTDGTGGSRFVMLRRADRN